MLVIISAKRVVINVVFFQTEPQLKKRLNKKIKK